MSVCACQCACACVCSCVSVVCAYTCACPCEHERAICIMIKRRKLLNWTCSLKKTKKHREFISKFEEKCRSNSHDQSYWKKKKKNSLTVKWIWLQVKLLLQSHSAVTELPLGVSVRPLATERVTFFDPGNQRGNRTRPLFAFEGRRCWLNIRRDDCQERFV